jgi:hypothetical protein
MKEFSAERLIDWIETPSLSNGCLSISPDTSFLSLASIALHQHPLVALDESQGLQFFFGQHVELGGTRRLAC